jgi:hypothetical protein
VTADGVDPLQMAQQFARRAPLRRGAEVIEGSERLVVGGDQSHQFLPLLGGQGLGQTLPQPQSGAMAHSANEAFQRGDAGQQHLMRQKPGARPVEQQSRPIIPGPTQNVEPTGQPKAGGGVLLEVTEPILLANGGGVTPALPTVAIGLQTGRRRFTELTRHGRDHRGRRLHRIVEKGAQEAGRPKLDGETNTVVRAAHRAHEFTVSGIEMEVPGELLLSGIASVAAVSSELFVGQKTARHGVRNSGLSQGSGHGPQISHLHAAKLLCGIGQLCDKFRTAAECQA